MGFEVEKEKINEIFSLQQNNKFRIAKTNYKERIDKLKSIYSWIENHNSDIYEALYKDLHKSESETDLSEILPVKSEILHAIKHLKKWMTPKRVPRSLVYIQTSSAIHFVPKGVVLIISPWNFPFMLSLGPVISALAAGNCIMIKPSELSSNTSGLINRMVSELFPQIEVAVFEGDLHVSIELLKKPFDHIFFTGSPEVGKKIMGAASLNLSSVTLELGGKSPAIVDSTADIKMAGQKLAWGKLLNSGQTCVAPDYVLVDQSVHDELITEIGKNVNNLYGDTEEARKISPDYLRIIDDRHFERLKFLLQDALEKGAKIEIGGEFDKKEKYFSPTVLSNVSKESSIMKEEIFGPILPVISFATNDEACDFVNNSLEKPLSMYLYSRDKKSIKRMITCTQSGGLVINEVLLQFTDINLPFGGMNHSGIGNSHGYFGFRAFSHERAVMRNLGFNLNKLLYPPFNKRAKQRIKLLLKYFY